MFKILVGQKLKEWNKDLIPKYEETEQLIFNSEKQAYEYLISVWSGAIYGYCSPIKYLPTFRNQFLMYIIEYTD